MSCQSSDSRFEINSDSIDIIGTTNSINQSIDPDCSRTKICLFLHLEESLSLDPRLGSMPSFGYGVEFSCSTYFSRRSSVISKSTSPNSDESSHRNEHLLSPKWTEHSNLSGGEWTSSSPNEGFTGRSRRCSTISRRLSNRSRIRLGSSGYAKILLFLSFFL